MIGLFLALAGLGAVTAPDTVAVAREDWQETLAELAVGDQTLSARQLADIAGPSSGPGRNLIVWSHRRRDDGSAVRLRVDLETGLWRGRLRGRRDGAANPSWSGAVDRRGRAWEAHGGWWTYQAGYGLLVGAAGRRPGLTADAGLRSPRSGGRGWTGEPEARALAGVVLTGRAAGWQATVGVGRAPDAVEPVVVVAAGRGSGLWSATGVLVAGRLMGAGLAGSWSRGPWSGSWESVWWDGGSPRDPVAGALAVAWRPRRSLRVEVLAVNLPAGPSPPLASGHELASGDGGRGWALRGSWRVVREVRLQGLVSRRWRRRTVPGREVRDLVDLQACCRLGSDGTLDLRYRSTSTTSFLWSADWPWLPPTATPSGRRTTLGATLTREQDTVRWRGSLRTLAVGEATTVGRRGLASGEVRRGFSGGLGLRGGWHEAWGAPVDLVSALSPVPGKLVPRHWGRWRQEVWIGAMIQRGWWRLAASAHRRTAADTGVGHYEIHAEGRVLW